ncbi:MAG: porin family protein [bacterium]
MKKLIILTALLTGLSFVGHAQMNIGFKAGLNMATISGDNTDNAEIIPSYQVGVTTNFSMGETFSLQPGLILSGKGSKYSEEFFGETLDYNMNLSYLEIPINAVYNIGGFQVYAGPYLGFGLFGKAKFDNDEIDDEDIEFTGDVTEETNGIPLNGFDYGLNFGVGYMLNESLQVQLGYGLGLGNLNPKFDGEDPEDSNANSVIQLSLSYFLQ